MRGVFLPLLLGFATCDLVVGRLDAYFFTCENRLRSQPTHTDVPAPNCTYDNIGEDDFSAHSGKYNVLSMNCASAEEVPGGGARKSVYVSSRRNKKDYCLTMSSEIWCEGENLGMDVANEGEL